MRPCPSHALSAPKWKVLLGLITVVGLIGLLGLLTVVGLVTLLGLVSLLKHPDGAEPIGGFVI